jgi:death-on-curing protein
MRYVLESVAAEMFGEPLYPTVTDKATVYMFSIISNRIFSDGNKRTGLEANLLFFWLNGFGLFDSVGSSEKAPIPSDQLYDFTIAVASGERDSDAVRV